MESVAARGPPAGFILRDDLLNEFRYAYHNHDDLKTRVAAVAEGAGDADMLQDLNDLAVIGRENPEPLKETNFDFDLLELAAEKSRTLGELRANASVDKEAYKAQKLLRNQAYTHLKQAVDEIRRAGKFLLRKNDDRLKGYSSSYKRRARQTEMNTEPEVTEALGQPEEAADTVTKTA